MKWSLRLGFQIITKSKEQPEAAIRVFPDDWLKGSAQQEWECVINRTRTCHGCGVGWRWYALSLTCPYRQFGEVALSERLKTGPRAQFWRAHEDQLWGQFGAALQKRRQRWTELVLKRAKRCEGREVGERSCERRAVAHGGSEEE